QVNLHTAAVGQSVNHPCALVNTPPSKHLAGLVTHFGHVDNSQRVEDCDPTRSENVHRLGDDGSDVPLALVADGLASRLDHRIREGGSAGESCQVFAVHELSH